MSNTSTTVYFISPNESNSNITNAYTWSSIQNDWFINTSLNITGKTVQEKLKSITTQLTTPTESVVSARYQIYVNYRTPPPSMDLTVRYAFAISWTDEQWTATPLNVNGPLVHQFPYAIVSQTSNDLLKAIKNATKTYAQTTVINGESNICFIQRCVEVVTTKQTEHIGKSLHKPTEISDEEDGGFFNLFD
jgi:hypothetical protein